MPCHSYTLQQRIFSYALTYSYMEVVTWFLIEYQGVPAWHRDTVWKLGTKFKQTGSILDKKWTVNKCVLTEEKLDKVVKCKCRFPKKDARNVWIEHNNSMSLLFFFIILLNCRPCAAGVLLFDLPGPGLSADARASCRAMGDATAKGTRNINIKYYISLKYPVNKKTDILKIINVHL